jgi:predicted amidophosphoribosyltransferase
MRLFSSLSQIIQRICQIILEAIFPLSEAERALAVIRAEDVWNIFPRSPRASISEACSLFKYKDIRISRLVWSLKYKKSSHAASLGGFALSCILKQYSKAATPVVIVPMPVSKQRRRERGFNQCDLLVDEIERLDKAKQLSFTRKLLIKSRHIDRQTLKDREHRLEEAHNIFSVNEKVAARLFKLLGIKQLDTTDSIASQSLARILSDAEQTPPNYLIIIIDDVITTGSTMKEAVRVLRAAGLTQTYGLSLAH